MTLHSFRALLVAAVLMAMLCGAHASEAPSELGWNKRALLTGSPVSARQLPARQGTPGQIVLAEQYRVRLENVDVVYGEIDVKRLTIDLQASQPTAITGNRRIFVLVEVRENGQYNALTWGCPLVLFASTVRSWRAPELAVTSMNSRWRREPSVLTLNGFSE